jgi:hypothetical protein
VLNLPLQFGVVSVQPAITYNLVNRSMKVAGYFLRQTGNRRSGGQVDGPRICLNFPIQQSHQRGLASAISAQQTNPLASVDSRRNSIQQCWTAKPNGKIVD